MEAIVEAEFQIHQFTQRTQLRGYGTIEIAAEKRQKRQFREETEFRWKWAVKSAVAQV